MKINVIVMAALGTFLTSFGIMLGMMYLEVSIGVIATAIFGANLVICCVGAIIDDQGNNSSAFARALAIIWAAVGAIFILQGAPRDAGAIFIGGATLIAAVWTINRAKAKAKWKHIRRQLAG